MDLRHLRYFIAVAEEGNLTSAAERRLHTAQPSLSRQIRDLEREVGATLLNRTAKGVELTSAGQVFLDHARLALLQVEAAIDAARRATQPRKSVFVVGFLTGQEAVWLSEILRIIREEDPDSEISLSSQPSPELASGLMRGTVDVAILRREPQMPGLAFKSLLNEPLVVVMDTHHPLAAQREIDIHEVANESWVLPAGTATTLRSVIDRYADEAGVSLKVQYETDNISSLMSLVAATGGLTLLPIYTNKLLLSSLITYRSLRGKSPTIEVVMGYSKSNPSPLLKRLLARTAELVDEVSGKRFFTSEKRR